MSTVTPQRITIGFEAIEEARETRAENLRDSTLVFHHADGKDEVLPTHLQKVLIRTLEALADSGEVIIGQMPEELTSTVAADTLGVSRPTLMKWVQEGKIDSYKVGSHTRFTRDVVFALKKQRAQDRRDAFAEFRAIDAEIDEMLEA